MLLKGGRVCDFCSDDLMDLRILDGIIVERGKELKQNQDEEVVDCSGCLITPSLIDLGIYSKNRVLSLQNLKNLNKKCQKGGVGSILFGADMIPSVDSGSYIEYLALANKELSLNVYASILGVEEDRVLDIASLHALGGRMIWTKSEDFQGHSLMVLANYAKMLKIPFFLTPLDSQLGCGVMNEGLLASHLGLSGIPEIAYSKESAMACEIARSFGVKMVLQIFDSASFELIKFAKDRGAEIEVQSSIHHLVLNENVYENYDTRAKIYPPLKNEEQRQILVEKLQSGEIAMLTSLQNAYYNSQKDQVFELASSGIDEISNYFSLLYTFLIKTKLISRSHLSLITSRNQAQVLGLKKGALDVGYDADLILVDENHRFVCEDSYSPYFGMELFAKIVGYMHSGILQRL